VAIGWNLIRDPKIGNQSKRARYLKSMHKQIEIFAVRIVGCEHLAPVAGLAVVDANASRRAVSD
jgi:hypothetical protein